MLALVASSRSISSTRWHVGNGLNVYAADIQSAIDPLSCNCPQVPLLFFRRRPYDSQTVCRVMHIRHGAQVRRWLCAMHNVVEY